MASDKVDTTPFILRHDIIVIWSVCLPFLLRFLEGIVRKHVLKLCYDKCCNGINPFRAALPIYNREGDFYNHGPNLDKIHELKWDECRLMYGYNFLTGFIVSAMRLIFWHMLQPIMYAFLLYAYSDVINDIQLKLGLIVAIRECIYFISIIIILFTLPSFLLVDIRAEDDWCKFICILLFYTLTPDKYIIAILIRMLQEKVSGKTFGFAYYFFEKLCLCILLLLSLMDCCGTAAFIIGLMNKSLPVALGISYIFTTFGGICLLPIICYSIM